MTSGMEKELIDRFCFSSNLKQKGVEKNLNKRTIVEKNIDLNICKNLML